MEGVGKPRILIVEDENDSVVLYKNKLEQDGFVVSAATDATAAAKEVERERPDLILLDLMLPGKSGFDFLDDLKNRDATRNIPVVALTNLAEEVGFERIMEKGATGYVVKAERTPGQVSLLIKQILQEKETT